MRKLPFLRGALSVILALSLALSLGISSLASGGPSEEPAEVREWTIEDLAALDDQVAEDFDSVIKIVHTNDVAGEIGTEPYAAGIRDGLKEYYGDENVFLISSGDVLHGNAIAALSNGQYPLDAMNAAGYDVMVLGNAELGFTNLIDEIAPQFQFPLLAANYYYKDGSRVFDDVWIAETESAKVGFFGLVYDMPSDNPGASGGCYTSEEIITPAEECVAKLQEENCDVIIALTHIGYGDSYKPYDDQTLADNVEGIHLICGGHSEVVLDTPYVGTTGAKLVMAGGDGKYLGIASIYLKDGAVVAVEDQLLSRDEYMTLEPNADVKAVTDAYEAEIGEKLAVVVGTSPYDLDGTKETVRNYETNLGDFITDAMRYWTGTDIAFFPGLKTRASVAAGEVTLQDLLDVVANGAVIYTVEITGQDLWDLVADYITDPMHFQQASGISYTWTMGEDGVRKLVSLQVGDEEVDLNATYTLTTDEAPASFCEAIAAALTTPICEDITEFATTVMQTYLNAEDAVILSSEEAVNRCVEVSE